MFKKSLTIVHTILFAVLIGFLAGGALPVLAQFGIEKLEKEIYVSASKITFETKPRFNRVEGFFPHAGIKMRLPALKAMAFAHGGYGLKNEKVRYDVGVHKYFFEANRLTLGFKLFGATTTNDGWMVSPIENSLAGVFLREDFYDYFETEGWRIVIDQTLWQRHTLRLEYVDYEYQDMATFSNFSGTLFGGNKVFRANPHFTVGNETSIKLSLVLDWRDSELFTTKGWYFEGMYEKTNGDFDGEGEIDTDGLFLTGKRYQPIWGNQRMVAKGMLGVRKGSVLPQHLMWIGGVGSLRGFRDRIAHGQNLVFFSINYLFGGDIMQHLPLQFVPLYDSITLGLFLEVGNAWESVNAKSSLFDGLSDFDPFSDAGVSLVIADGLLHVDFARQVKGGDNSWRITFRLLEKL